MFLQFPGFAKDSRRLPATIQFTWVCCFFCFCLCRAFVTAYVPVSLPRTRWKVLAGTQSAKGLPVA